MVWFMSSKFGSSSYNRGNGTFSNVVLLSNMEALTASPTLDPTRSPSTEEPTRFPSTVPIAAPTATPTFTSTNTTMAV